MTAANERTAEMNPSPAESGFGAGWRSLDAEPSTDRRPTTGRTTTPTVDDPSDAKPSTARTILGIVCAVAMAASGLLRLYVAFQPSTNSYNDTTQIELIHTGDCLDKSDHVVACGDPEATQRIVRLLDSFGSPSPFASPTTTAFGSSASFPAVPGGFTNPSCPAGSTWKHFLLGSGCVVPA